MPRSNEQLLKQEVQELTDLLRTDSLWADLRTAITKKGFPSDEILLAGHIENAEWEEYGAVVTKTGKVYEFERSNHPDAPLEFKRFSQVKDVEKLARDKYPAVKEALKMVQTGLKK